MKNAMIKTHLLACQPFTISVKVQLLLRSTESIICVAYCAKGQDPDDRFIRRAWWSVLGQIKHSWATFFNLFVNASRKHIYVTEVQNNFQKIIASYLIEGIIVLL